MILNTALAHLEPSKVTIYNNIAPLVALLAGVIFLHEHILPLQVVGAILVIGGVYMAVRFEIAETQQKSSELAPEVSVEDGEGQHHEHAEVDHHFSEA